MNFMPPSIAMKRPPLKTVEHKLEEALLNGSRRDAQMGTVFIESITMSLNLHQLTSL